MKSLIFIVVTIAAMVATGCHSTKESTRDLAYEQYCDSIYNTNPDYYLDVLCESDEYCEYLEINGKWW